MPEVKQSEEKIVDPIETELKAEVEKMVSARVTQEVEKLKKELPVYKMIKEDTEGEKVETKEAETEIAKFAVCYGPWDREEALTKVLPESSPAGIEYYGGVQTPSLDKRTDGVRFKQALEDFHKYTYTQTGGAGTAGYALIPVYVDPDIIDRTRREIPFIEMLPRRATQGLTYDYNFISALTNAVTLNEDASLDDLTDTYDRASTNMTYIYSTGRVTGPTIAARKGYVDALNLEVQNRTIGLKRYEDQLCLQTAATSPEMSSLNDLISTNQTALGGALTISAIRTELAQCRDAGGVINLIVLTNTLSNSLKGLMMDYQRWVDTTKIAWGIETMSFDGIPVIVDRYVPTGYVYLLDMSVIFMAVLQDIVYEELAKTNDSVKFTLKAYEALICRAEAFCSILTGCT
jgi:hypothetical protein